MAKSSMPNGRKGQKPKRHLPAVVYDQMIDNARELRQATGDLPKRRSRAAACLAHTVLNLYNGNVLIKVGVLARKLGVDLHTLTRGFANANIPYPPKEMQIHIRNIAARSMLCSERSRKIDSIAAELGYDDPGSFSKFFQKTNGMSPGEYRRTYGRERTRRMP